MTTASDEQQVMKLEHHVHEAFLQGDAETLDRILAEDFIFTDPEGRLVTKAEWMADMTSGAVTYDSIHQDDLQVRVYGDAAVTIGRVTMKGRSAQEGDFHGQYCYTCMYVRREGRWQAVAEQATLLAQQ
jgi:ketosteroid isomerase-like protein